MGSAFGLPQGVARISDSFEGYMCALAAVDFDNQKLADPVLDSPSFTFLK
jgi:hypothetical protein